jgi:23S rRNA pseudouridine1911/1915/1917 synthase
VNDRTEIFTVEVSRPGERFDFFLRTKFPAASRGALQRLIEQGHIRVNGKPVKATHSPRAGEQVEVHWPEAKAPVAQPEDMPLDILFEDKSLLVLNKPAGLVVHPAAGHEEHTLVNALLHHCKDSLSGIGGVLRPGIVHRLDKDTTGCLIVAKNDATHIALSKQFSERQVDKVYNAIVCGAVNRESGDIRAPIARHTLHRKRMAVREDDGRTAHTSYQVIERLKSATLVEARIHTGRTHQIRVHFEYLGYPVVGDITYGLKQNKKLIESTGFKPPRILLHARELSLIHPGTEKQMNFEAPLPKDFRDALKALRSKTPGK